MKMAGYSSRENNLKAAEIRDLVNEANQNPGFQLYRDNLNEADNLSVELAEYLRDNIRRILKFSFSSLVEILRILMRKVHWKL